MQDYIFTLQDGSQKEVTLYNFDEMSDKARSDYLDGLADDFVATGMYEDYLKTMVFNEAEELFPASNLNFSLSPFGGIEIDGYLDLYDAVDFVRRENLHSGNVDYVVSMMNRYLYDFGSEDIHICQLYGAYEPYSNVTYYAENFSEYMEELDNEADQEEMKNVLEDFNEQLEIALNYLCDRYLCDAENILDTIRNEPWIMETYLYGYYGDNIGWTENGTFVNLDELYGADAVPIGNVLADEGKVA